MFGSRYMPCADCGASVDRESGGDHTCEGERWLDFQLFQLRDEIAAFESLLTEYLESPCGRFEVWYAAMRRRAR